MTRTPLNQDETRAFFVDYIPDESEVFLSLKTKYFNLALPRELQWKESRLAPIKGSVQSSRLYN
jgi:hypothetical protein